MSIKTVFNKYWPLLMVVLIGGSLRFYGLLQNPISLFSDEVDMGYQAYSLIKTGCDYSGHCLPVQFYSFSDVQPPIPIYLIALLNILGINLELAIRLVPAIFGTLGILMTYLFVENLRTKKIFDIDLPYLGVISASLLALVPWHLTYSRLGFSLALLYFFVVSGLYLFTEYLIKQKNRYLCISFILLGLTPMVYNTAKMAIVFYPFLLLIFPNSYELLKNNIKAKILSLFLFIPLIIMFLVGGTAARFNYISIFTDPTARTEVNYQRLLDSGPKVAVGTTTSTFSKIFHSKPVFYLQKLSNNFFGLISADYLFSNGDPNLRHSPKNWGMIYKTLLLPLLLGIYYIIRSRKDKLLMFLSLFVLISISTSAITRDGFAHASRSFMFILPLVIVSAIGLSFLLQNYKYALYFLALSILVESVFFVHDYWYHYRYDSEKSWSAGMKELIQATQKHRGQPIVISPKNENPLIFYAFYNRFDPKKFQEQIKGNTLFNNLNGKFNLDGHKIGDTDLYVASIIDYQNLPADPLPNAIYYLTKLETINSGIRSITFNSSVIRLPSGEPLYYEIHY